MKPSTDGHETDVTIPEMSLGLRLCASREGGTRDVGGFRYSVLCRGNMAVS